MKELPKGTKIPLCKSCRDEVADLSKKAAYTVGVVIGGFSLVFGVKNIKK